MARFFEDAIDSLHWNAGAIELGGRGKFIEIETLDVVGVDHVSA